MKRWFLVALAPIPLLLPAIPAQAKPAENVAEIHFYDQARVVTLTIPIHACKMDRAHLESCAWELFVNEPNAPGQPTVAAVSGSSGVLSIPYPAGFCGILQADVLFGKPLHKDFGHQHQINTCNCRSPGAINGTSPANERATQAKPAENVAEIHFYDQARVVTLTIPIHACKMDRAHLESCAWELFVNEPTAPGQPTVAAVSGSSGVLSVPYPAGFCGLLQADVLFGKPFHKDFGHRHQINTTQSAGTSGPATLPGSPTGVTAFPEPGGAELEWNPPAFDGGAPITEYKILATDSTNPVNGGQSARTKGDVGQLVRGLTAGDSYSFTVTATNSIGTAPASSPSNAVVPTRRHFRPSPAEVQTGSHG